MFATVQGIELKLDVEALYVLECDGKYETGAGPLYMQR